MTNPLTYVITLQSQPERQARCSAHLQERGYAAYSWRGVDAAKMGLQTRFTHSLPDGTDYNPPAKHVGLCLSHWMLWRELMVLRHFPETEFDHYGIMEDDVILDPNWKSMLDSAMADLPEDWDILFAGSCHVRTYNPTHYKGLLWKCEKPNCTHFYLVRAKALPVLIDACERIYTNIDWAIIEQALPKLNSFVVLPRIAGQHGMEDLPE